MGDIYGYARCSTNESKQDINRQKRELMKNGVPEENIYWEYEHGTKDDRIELTRMFEKVKAGDAIVTTELYTRSHNRCHDKGNDSDVGCVFRNGSRHDTAEN